MAYLGQTPAGGWWQQGDKVSPLQLALWLNQLKARGFTEQMLVDTLGQWRTGKLGWGELPSPMPPLARVKSPAGGVGFEWWMWAAIAGAVFMLLKRR